MVLEFGLKRWVGSRKKGIKHEEAWNLLGIMQIGAGMDRDEAKIINSKSQFIQVYAMLKNLDFVLKEVEPLKGFFSGDWYNQSYKNTYRGTEEEDRARSIKRLI